MEWFLGTGISEPGLGGRGGMLPPPPSKGKYCIILFKGKYMRYQRESPPQNESLWKRMLLEKMLWKKRKVKKIEKRMRKEEEDTFKGTVSKLNNWLQISARGT